MITQKYTLTENDFINDAPDTLTAANTVMEHYPQLKDGIFFDIETTGFSAAKNALYLIGCCWYESGQWQLVQWLAEDKGPVEQSAVLNAFFDQLKAFSTIISYNGASFDLPFIEKKSRLLGISADFSSWNHMDLYKILRPWKNILGLENLKLKTVEHFLGIYREDMYSGGALIPVYETFAKSRNPRLLQLLLLHNYEDIKNMLPILPVLAYDLFLNGQFHGVQVENSIHTAQVKITLIPDVVLPKALPQIQRPIGFTPDTADEIASPGLPNTDISLQIERTQAILILPSLCGELKYFYENYKDYYYLPKEDCAVHKSVAEFVDRDYRKKATPATCYTKKAGVFLPQGHTFFTPAYKYNIKDALSWFEYSDNLFTEKNLSKYIQSFLRFLILGSF